MLLGSHVSMSGKKMLLGSAEEAFSFGENTFMIYTGAPQNTKRKPIDEMNIPAGQAYMQDHDLSHIVVHAPYIINLGNTKKPDKFEFAVQFLHDEIVRAQALGAHQMTLHPGAHVGAGSEAAIENIAKGLNEVLTKDQTVQIAIETMAGKGTEVGKTFEQIAQMIEKIKLDDKVSVTLDTCHANDAGYDIKNDFDGVLNDFDHVIGLDRLKVIHLNDSKNPMGSHKDRHANIGFGTIGFDALNYVAHHEQLQNISKILETPYVGPDKKHKYAPYAYEIQMLKKQEFNSDMLDEILKNKGKLV
ncbi:deoxyribonuclease IV [Ligilactobacillus cholophilus]|uniref:deoxyribonuclease IV n=1 Tax=Ligilactobacillus cholophilus TaxID=3050131 RepID=UPI0025B245B0|nr:deoxyribonuclease IV [Ligilactobacillus cholophilus]